MRQKFSGSPFGAFISIKKDNFKYTHGRELVKTFQSSEWASRVFCSNCGSSLMYLYHKTPEELSVAAGSIEGNLDILPQKHIFVKDKCSWFEITDDLEQVERY